MEAPIIVCFELPEMILCTVHIIIIIIILFDESPVNRGPNDLTGGDGHSVELIEARNQSWKP